MNAATASSAPRANDERRIVCRELAFQLMPDLLPLWCGIAVAIAAVFVVALYRILKTSTLR